MFRPNKKNLVFYAVVFFVIVSLSASVPFLKKPALFILKIPLTVFSAIGREFKGIIFYHNNMVKAGRLSKEVGLLSGKLERYEEAVFENQRLRNLLSLKKEAPYKVIASRVIARSPDNWASVVIIDKGRFHGIRNGFAVLSYHGLAGRVIEAGERLSKVMLINDPNLSVSCIVSRSRQEGLVCGTLSNRLIMKYLPPDADVIVSDTVLTSGLTQNYPKNLLLGTVTEVGEEFSGLSRYAIIKPSTNFSNLEEVLVIIP
ncbi:MAG: rod shape-determining protein MreC [Candidatus Omnitrophica bacterium]|nr:rod shape-determining protein MreC [Candidatus Omnitrophota bacterium]